MPLPPMALNSVICLAISSRRMYCSAHIDRQLQRLVPAAQRFIEAALDPGEAFVVDAGIADDMGERLPLG